MRQKKIGQTITDVMDEKDEDEDEDMVKLVELDIWLQNWFGRCQKQRWSGS